MINHYKKGSIWRRWEPHIHTPGTIKNDQFVGSDLDDKWINYISDINAYPDEIAVIAITDYLSIDNYHQFKEAIDDGRITKQFDLILPNIELRVTPVTSGGTPINIHCLFNPAFVSKLNDRFYSKLKSYYQTRDFLATKSDLIELGRKYKNAPTLREEDAYREGIKVFVPNIEHLKTIFAEDDELRHNCLIVVSNSSNDGASGLQGHSELIEGERHNSIDAVRQTIYYLCDGIFSSKPKDIDYFLGKGVDSLEEIKRKCRNMMPCLHGSDAHKNSKILRPDGNRYCWIKADPTFEGLRQIVFEPESRIRIQEDRPEQKRPHLFIDKVRFVSTGGNSTFPSDFIEINQNLNSIIGGKSSGKSLLLYFIAKTIDPSQTAQKISEFGSTNHYDFESSIPGFDFEVHWGDEIVNRLTDDVATKNRQITYLPQMYINNLAEKKGNEELKRLIESILSERDNFEEFHSKTRDEISRLKGVVAGEVLKYFDGKSKLHDLEEQLRGKGDKSARESNLALRKQELEVLRTESGFSEVQETDYTLQTSRKQIHAARLISLETLKGVLADEYNVQLRRIEQGLIRAIDDLNTQTDAKFIGNDLVRSMYQNLVGDFKTSLISPFQPLYQRITKKLQQLERCIATTKEKIDLYDKLLAPYLEKITKKDKLQEIQRDISQEEASLGQIKEIEQRIDVLVKMIAAHKTNIIQHYTQMMAEYQKVVAEVNTKYSEINPDKEIRLKAILSFDVERLAQSCTNHITKYSTLAAQFGAYFDGHDFIFNEGSHLSNVADFFEKVLSADVRLNQGATKNLVCEKMFDDYFEIDFEIFQKEESIFKMSPGKKGLILLYLILHLSNASYPILIDQPEDNLDNRTVYRELKDFIKSKKIERQVLIVTHNANLVVPTDSELVIVANQSGQDQGKNNAHYRFEYVTGSLENTFIDSQAAGILDQMGVREHVCDVLEGGEDAFKERELRYEIA